MNAVLFLNSFLSYLLLVAVFVAVSGIAVFIGITLRKRANKKEAAAVAENTTKPGDTNEI